MDFDWNSPAFEWDSSLTLRDIEESFEDPFAIKLLPDSPRFSVQSRYFNLGRTSHGVGIFSVYRTNGKVFRVIFARVMGSDETFFYQRKVNQALAP